MKIEKAVENKLRRTALPRGESPVCLDVSNAFDLRFALPNSVSKRSHMFKTRLKKLNQRSSASQLEKRTKKIKRRATERKITEGVRVEKGPKLT